MPKRKKNSVHTNDKAKVARTLRTTNSTLQSSQTSQLSDSWLSSETTLTADNVDVGENSQAGDNVNNVNIRSCYVCKEEIIQNEVIDENIIHLKCCLCDTLYHGECLSIDDSILPHLHLITSIGGWSCAPCQRRFRQVLSKTRPGVRSSQITDVVNSLPLASENGKEPCGDTSILDICEGVSVYSVSTPLTVFLYTMEEDTRVLLPFAWDFSSVGRSAGNECPIISKSVL